MKHKILIALIGVIMLGAGIVWAGPIEGRTLSLYTVRGFVDMLIERGIIPASVAEKARELAGMVEKIDDTESAEPEQWAQHADVAEVSVSQLIEHANLTFAPGEDIEGLLLLLKNASTSPLLFEAKRGCQVVYAIYNESDELVFDGATLEKCTTDEKVQYLLEAGASRMFEIKHRQADKELAPGTYRFVLTYPGYGEGERTVTVTQ